MAVADAANAQAIVSSWPAVLATLALFLLLALAGPLSDHSEARLLEIVGAQ